MSEILTVGGHPLTYGGFLLGFIDPNPLNLPAYTMRFLFDPPYNPTSYSWASNVTWTQVSSEPNIWDYTRTGTGNSLTDWSFAFNDYHGGPGLVYAPGEVLGANTTGVTEMAEMFRHAPGLRSVALFDTSNVTTMSMMFAGCTALSEVPRFDTRNVTSMFNMFFGCSSLTTVPLFNTSKVTYMAGMFEDCTALTSVPLFDTSNVTNMDSTFYNCISVESGALALYQQASTQATPPSSHLRTFTSCGSNTTTGQAELAQIPSDWK